MPKKNPPVRLNSFWPYSRLSLALAVTVIGFTVMAGYYYVRLSTAAVNPPVIGAAAAPPSYQLTWSDEFNGSAVDTGLWNVLSNSNYGSGNREDQCYQPANATVAGGYLTITGKKQTVTCGGTNPDTGSKTYYWTSAFLKSKTNFVRGYLEASVKAPKGNPWWPAFWLTGGTGAPGWPAYGEIDVMEDNGIYPDVVFGTYHWQCSTGHCQSSPHTYNLATGTTSNGTQQTAANLGSYTGLTTSQYVRYGVLWEADRLTWYINGRPIRSINRSGVVQQYDANGNPTTEKTFTGSQLTGLAEGFGYNHVINLNLAIGGSMPMGNGYTGKETSSGYSNGNLAANVPGSMMVDYVRVYTWSSATAAPVTATPRPSIPASATATPPPNTQPTNSPTATMTATPNPPTATPSVAPKVTPRVIWPAESVSPDSAIPVTYIDLSEPMPEAAVEVEGVVGFVAGDTSDPVSLTVDGVPQAGDQIDTTALLNGAHVVTVEQGGTTRNISITVNNPWYSQMINVLAANRGLSIGLVLLVVAGFTGGVVIWCRHKRNAR